MTGVIRFLENREDSRICLKIPLSFFKNSNLGFNRDHPKSVVLNPGYILESPGAPLKITHASRQIGWVRLWGQDLGLAFVQSFWGSLMHSWGWEPLFCWEGIFVEQWFLWWYQVFKFKQALYIYAHIHMYINTCLRVHGPSVLSRIYLHASSCIPQMRMCHASLFSLLELIAKFVPLQGSWLQHTGILIACPGPDGSVFSLCVFLFYHILYSVLYCIVSLFQILCGTRLGRSK